MMGPARALPQGFCCRGLLCDCLRCGALPLASCLEWGLRARRMRRTPGRVTQSLRLRTLAVSIRVRCRQRTI